MSRSENDPQHLVQAGYRYALALTHHHYDAEDLVQQAWLKLTHRYGHVKHRTILYTAIRHLFYDQCRRGKIVTFGPLEDSPEPTSSESAPSCDDLDVLLAGLPRSAKPSTSMLSKVTPRVKSPNKPVSPAIPC